MASPASPTPSPDTWDTLIKRWQREELTVEQAIGQLLLWGRYLHNEIVQVQRFQAQLERQLAAWQTEQEKRTPS